MNFRIERLNELLKQKLLTKFLFDFHDEIISINFIHTEKDLSSAKIYISVASNKQSIYDAVIKSAGKYGREIASEQYIRKFPKLIFIRDEMQDAVERVEQILN
ncbi:MAG: ribosome-binding factor A [Candidatus Berkelbacteria bacterium]|nr:ribosome-binding factor A [Candidatus Berkelbacteria bacterium]